MSTGWLLVVAGIALVIVGLLVVAGAFAWFGRLPGDIRFGGDDGVRVFIPITSMLLISLVLTLLLNLLLRRL